MAGKWGALALSQLFALTKAWFVPEVICEASCDPGEF
jgi:hypothetical protein